MSPDGPRILYTSPHVPPEWIAAHDCAPCRITPESGVGTVYSGMGVCPYAAAVMRIVKEQPDAAAVVLTTACDQVRRQSELLAEVSNRPVFLMHVPTSEESPTARPLYRDEILSMRRILEHCGGTPPEAAYLAETMAHYETARERLRAAREWLGGRAFSQAIMRFHYGDWSVLDAPCAEQEALSGVPLALAGGPLRPSDVCLFNEIEAAGGQVALDATTTGERSLPAPFDSRILRESPLEALLKAYFNIPDAFQRPNTGLYAWLRAAIAERGIRGIILRHYVWCDTWHIEAARMEEATALPVLRLDVGEEEDSARQAGRILAFLEMVS